MIRTQTLDTVAAANGCRYVGAVAWDDRPRACPRCGQTVRMDRCPVTLDGGGGAFATWQTWDHRHGCGEWVAPPYSVSGIACAGLHTLPVPSDLVAARERAALSGLIAARGTP